LNTRSDEKKYGIPFLFSLFCEYTTHYCSLEYACIHHTLFTYMYRANNQARKPVFVFVFL